MPTRAGDRAKAAKAAKAAAAKKKAAKAKPKAAKKDPTSKYTTVPRRRPRKGPYTKRQLAPLRRELLERRARLAGDLTRMGDEALRATDPDVDADSVADHGSDAYERNLTLGLMEHDSRTLQQIDKALEAMQDGSYGLCSTCEEAIPLARLEALPFATTCVPCQEKSERSW